MLGYRNASFYSGTVLQKRIDCQALHRRIGGAVAQPQIPRSRTRRTLNELLRVSGAVLGVLPADRKCFRFAHLAKEQGWRNMDIALALSLTSRRIRQLLSQTEPNLHLAYSSLGDARLAQAV